jgi:hypothetical protein
VDFDEEDAGLTAKGDCNPSSVSTRLSETDDGSNGGENMREPFSGDLQIMSEREESSSVLSPVVTRRRRKLPEIPKNPPRRCN